MNGGAGNSNEWAYWRFKNGHEPLGAFGEKLWSRVFVGCGLFYVPLANLPAINGKGPRLQGNDAVLPDFQVSGRRRPIFVDSKAKTGPVLFRKANELRHGIDFKYYESYEAVSAINRQDCALAVLELFTDERTQDTWSGALLVQTLSRLGKPCHGFSTEHHMCYWPRRLFQQVAVVEPLELWRLASGESQPSNELRAALDECFGRQEKAIQSRMF